MKTSRRAWLRTGVGATLAGMSPALLPRAAGGDGSAGEAARMTADERSFLGASRQELPTPSLLLDLDAFEANVGAMARHAKTAGIALRPHGKTHKCPEIAKRQIQAGAIGLCATTIREAEAFAAAGIRGLLITTPMVGRNKIPRLIAVTRRAPDTMSVVDHPDHVRQLSEAAGAAKVTLNVLVDIDPGMRRTGIPGGDGAVALAELADSLPHLQLRGLCAYSGASAHVIGYEARRAHSEGALGPARETFTRLKKKGMPVEILSGGSTGTYNIDVAHDLTELQVGSYVFMDVEYINIGGRSGPVYDDFKSSLTVLASVVSKSHREVATVDAGLKAFATDRKFGPTIKDVTGVTYRFAGDEHGVLELQQPSRAIALGDRLEFIVPHCDPNVNLYDRVFCMRGDKAEAIWTIARGYA